MPVLYFVVASRNYPRNVFMCKGAVSKDTFRNVNKPLRGCSVVKPARDRQWNWIGRVPRLEELRLARRFLSCVKPTLTRSLAMSSTEIPRTLTEKSRRWLGHDHAANSYVGNYSVIQYGEDRELCNRWCVEILPFFHTGSSSSKSAARKTCF